MPNASSTAANSGIEAASEQAGSGSNSRNSANSSDAAIVPVAAAMMHEPVESRLNETPNRMRNSPDATPEIAPTATIAVMSAPAGKRVHRGMASVLAAIAAGSAQMLALPVISFSVSCASAPATSSVSATEMMETRYTASSVDSACAMPAYSPMLLNAMDTHAVLHPSAAPTISSPLVGVCSCCMIPLSRSCAAAFALPAP